MQLLTFCFNVILILCTTKIPDTLLQFTAAVVEYYPEQDRNLPADQRLLKNIQNYVELLSGIDKKVDMVVFPESTLAQNAVWKSREDVVNYAMEIPDEFDGTSLCNYKTTSIFLYYLACSTLPFNNTYLSINLLERAPCVEEGTTQCSTDRWNLYNTNIVLDKNRALVAKYRKYNLFGEYYMNQTTIPDISIFETDFGVKFGTFICFDILFRKPALSLIKDHGISHIIYPAMWFSELPFLTALQTQQQWAQETNTVLLASGANDPKVGSGGTGIFYGASGPIIYDILENSGSKVVIGSVPKNGDYISVEKDTNDIDALAKQFDSFYLKKDDLQLYNSVLITPNQKEIKETVCSGADNNKICCQFDITMKWNQQTLQDGKNHYQYQMVAFSGIRSFSGVYNGGVEICGVVACIDKTPDSCGERFTNYDTISWPVTFTKMSITANYTVDDNRIQFPNSLISSIRPLPIDATEWTHNFFKNKTIIERTNILKKPEDRLMTFAIYGRDFNRDGPPSFTNE